MNNSSTTTTTTPPQYHFGRGSWSDVASWLRGGVDLHEDLRLHFACAGRVVDNSRLPMHLSSRTSTTLPNATSSSSWMLLAMAGTSRRDTQLELTGDGFKIEGGAGVGGGREGWSEG
ncbi:unnamed protein product [Prorocentrum cordatum]|uniref:Uncharacterized protein n=1 Tax=Prorocentrum cordatum TaxID=2364126 RepID=A0ABN9S5W4_9DINO|nr:unnamed protein product [Polarella glacialis]